MPNLNSFPLVLAIKSDGNVDRELRTFEGNLRATANRASSAMETAGRQADRAFAFDRANRDAQQFSRQVDAIAEKLGRFTRIQGLNHNPFSGMESAGIKIDVSSQARAEQILEQQRRRDHDSRMSSIQSEVDAALSGIRARQAAEAASFQQAQTEGNRLLALSRQRVEESARMVAGPQRVAGVTLDPGSAQQSAAAARAYANAQRDIAEAATRAARAVDLATAEDRAYAVTAREAAAAAELEARRMEGVAATHRKVAGALVDAGGSLTRTSAAAATSAGAQRAAYANLSNQIADVAVQAQMGTNAFTILLQQGTQASFAMAQAGGKLGTLGRFLTNPWVAALTTAALVLGTFVTKLGEAGDASNLAKIGANALSDAQSVLGTMFDLTSGKLEKQNELLRLNARLTAINLRADAASKAASAAKVFGNDSLSVTTRRVLPPAPICPTASVVSSPAIITAPVKTRKPCALWSGSAVAPRRSGALRPARAHWTPCCKNPRSSISPACQSPATSIVRRSSTGQRASSMSRSQN